MTSTRNRIGLAALAAVAAIAAWLFVGSRTTPPPPIDSGTVPHAADAVASRGAGTAPRADGASPRAVPVIPAGEVPVRLRLVAADSRAPLPHYAVRLAREANEVSTGPVLASDERGELTIPATLRGKALTVVALDDPLTGQREPQHLPIAANAWPAGDAPLELAVAVGPTYTVEFDQTPPPEPLDAVLVPGVDPLVPGAAVPARVRPGPRPWVRLDPAGASPARLGAGPWSLVASAPSGWLAAGPVRLLQGVQQDAVLLRRVATGTLIVAPTLGGKPPDRAGLHATVQPVDVADAPTGRDRSLAIDERSPRATFALLPIGRYRVDVRGAGEHAHSEIAEVRDGGTTTVVCDFPASGEPRPLQVIATSQSRTRELFSVAFAARKVGSDEVAWSRWVRDEPGRKVHQFAQLSAGEWDVEVQPTPHLPPWAAPVQRVNAGAGTIEFVCLDANAPPPGYANVRVLDAATGKAIPAAGATSFVDGRQHLTTSTDAGGVAVFGPYLTGKPFQVLVQAEGRVPQLADVVAAADRAVPPRDVALAAGWGTLLVVRRPEPGTSGVPLPGVEVFADGIAVGRTDTNGLLLLAFAAKPARLELRHAQWVVASGGVDPETGAIGGGEHAPLAVTMRAKQ